MKPDSTDTERSRDWSVAIAPGFAQRAEFALPTDLLTNDNTLSIELQGNVFVVR